MQRIKNFLFVNTSAKQTVIKNTFWLFMGEASGRLLKIALIIYATRKLGAEGWGVFSYVISIASLSMIFSDIGISSIITREAAQEKEDYKKFISATLVLKSIILIISIIFVIFLSPYISNIKEANILFPIIGIVLFFDSIRDIGIAINRVFEKMEREMVMKVLMNLIILVLGVFLIKINPFPVSMAIAYAIGSIFGFIIIIIMIRKNIWKLITKTDINSIKQVIKTTIPFAIVTLLGTIMSNTDIYMLGIWKSPTDIGIYSAAQRFYQFIIIIPSMIGSATLPLMSRLANKDNVKFKFILEKIISIFMIIGIPIALGGFILADQIIPLMFGLEYTDAIPVLKIFMIMLLVSFPLILLSNTIFVYNEQKKLARSYILGVLTNIVLNFLLIQKFGAIGAAVTSLISTAVITFVIWRQMKKINDFKTLPWLKEIIIPIVIMTLSILTLKSVGINVILNIILSSLTYFCILILIKKSILKELKDILIYK